MILRNSAAKVLSLAVLLLSITAHAGPEVHLAFGKGFGIASQEQGEQVVQIHAVRMHPVFENLGQFRLGYGLRLAHFSADQILGSPFEITAMNAGFQASYQGLSFIELGMNLDVMGFSVGGATTERFNLLLGGKNDRGFLGSEFFIQSRVLDPYFVRLSFGHLATEQSPTAAGRRQDFTDVLLVNIGYILP